MKELIYDYRAKNPLGQKLVGSVYAGVNKNGWL